MPATSNSIVFVTGAFISHSCWDEWIQFFQSKGYVCMAPAWPLKDASAEELRNRPVDDAMASNTLSSLTDYFANIIIGLPEKPIMIGHSIGGLIVQLLLQRKLGCAGVAIHSFPPQGVNRFWLSFIKAIWETMVLFSSAHETYLMSFNKWRMAMANGMDYDKQKETYYRYAVPESKNIIRDAFNCIAIIDFKKPHAPLLLTSGGDDKLIPASLNYSNYRKYAGGDSITDYIENKRHTHLVFDVPAWKEEAEFVLQWLKASDKSDNLLSH